MTVKTELYDEVEVVSKNSYQYEIEIKDGNDVGLEWIDAAKCKVLKE
jgi:hypothetical protein